MKDEDINKVVKENEIQAEGWVYSNLSELLYDWFDRFNVWFFGNALKTPVISFEKTRINSLGHFVIGRNAFGLKWNINVNSMYASRHLVDTLSTLLHEMVHQQIYEFGRKKPRSSNNNYHNKEYRLKADQLGIPCDEYGRTLYYRNPYLSFLKSQGVKVKPRFTTDKKDEVDDFSARPGISKTKKWSCGCQIARVGRRVFRVTCDICGRKFIKFDE
jgi:hypothetical protein